MALLVAVIVFAFSLLPGRPSALPLVVPTQADSHTATLPVLATTIVEPTGTQIPSPIASIQVEAPDAGVIEYTVMDGDTLLSIADRFGVPVASISELNNLQMGDVLFPGTKLLIPLSTPTAVPSEPQAYVITRNAQVNLRSGPGTQYEVVGLLDIGDKLLKNGDVGSDGWLPVEYPPGSGETAWVWVELVIVMDSSDVGQGVPAPADWVRASNPRTLDDRLLVDVCFNLLDDGDWMVQDAVLRIDQTDASLLIAFDSSNLISVRPFTTDSEGTHTGERCDVLEFPLEPGAVLQNPVLSVLSLEAYPREGQDCALYTEKVQPLLTARDTGILITCEPVSHASGDVTVVSKPDEMSLEAAQALVYQAFQDAITLRGPWEFNLAQMLSADGEIPDLLEQHPLLAELRALNLLRSKNFISAPGWVHLQYRAMYQQSGGTLPDGRQIPAEYRMDEWYELDDKGQIVRTVARMLDLSGELLQVAVLQEGEFTNYTYRGTNPQDVFYLQPLDFGFTDLAENALKTDKAFSKQPLTVDGSYVGDMYVIQDERLRRDSVYDPVTGKQLSFTTWQVIPEGLQLVSSVVVETLENTATPSPDVLVLLETTPGP
jgi:LysM repeat protein